MPVVSVLLAFLILPWELIEYFSLTLYNSNLNLRMTIFPVYCLTLTVCHEVIGAKSAKNEGVLVMPI